MAATLAVSQLKPTLARFLCSGCLWRSYSGTMLAQPRSAARHPSYSSRSSAYNNCQELSSALSCRCSIPSSPRPAADTTVASVKALVPTEDITRAILVLRGHRVLLDTELAALYGVTTKRFNEQVRRNRKRFPEDFTFQLSTLEAAALRSQIATSNAPPQGRGGRRYSPYAFTEHGAIMAATILNSPRAVEMSVYVVRAFVQLRELLPRTSSWLAGSRSSRPGSIKNSSLRRSYRGHPLRHLSAHAPAGA